MFTEVSAPHKCGWVLKLPLPGRFQALARVGGRETPGQVTKPREVREDLAWVWLLCLAGSRLLKDGLVGNEAVFSESCSCRLPHVNQVNFCS